MKQIPSDKTTRPTPDREHGAREREPTEPTEPTERESRERDWRIGATQMAAPPTRRWRRAGRFEQAS
jgi:hypothetical protein